MVDSIDISNKESKIISYSYGLKWWDIWALGITIVIGGQYFSWNIGLESGFGSFIISTLFMGFAYIALCLSVSELTSALPFAGGAYGLARCTLGFLPGFLIGASESIEYIFYVSASVIFLTEMLCFMNDAIAGYKPLIWLIFYVLTCSIYIFGGKWFWRINMFLALLSITISLMYCFGSMAFINLPKYGTYNDVTNGWFIGGSSSFMHTFPLAAWFFVGVESLSFSCDDIEDPKINVPKGQIACVLTLFVTCMLTLIVTAGLPPDIASTSIEDFPFDIGFSYMFNNTSRLLLILSIPATFATAFGFVYSYSKMLAAMSASNLWPKTLSRKYSKTGANAGSILVGSILSYFACLAGYYSETFSRTLYNVCILSAFMCYSCQCYGYVALQTYYSKIPRQFRSPLGIPGAVFSFSVWILGIISIIFFQNDNYLAISIYACVIGILTVYYYGYAYKRQTLSEDERSILFVAHVINNSKKRSSEIAKQKENIPYWVKSAIRNSEKNNQTRRFSRSYTNHQQHVSEINVNSYKDVQVSMNSSRRNSVSSLLIQKTDSVDIDGNNNNNNIINNNHNNTFMKLNTFTSFRSRLSQLFPLPSNNNLESKDDDGVENVFVGPPIISPKHIFSNLKSKFSSSSSSSLKNCETKYDEKVEEGVEEEKNTETAIPANTSTKHIFSKLKKKFSSSSRRLSESKIVPIETLDSPLSED